MQNNIFYFYSIQSTNPLYFITCLKISIIHKYMFKKIVVQHHQNKHNRFKEGPVQMITKYEKYEIEALSRKKSIKRTIKLKEIIDLRSRNIKPHYSNHQIQELLNQQKFKTVNSDNSQLRASSHYGKFFGPVSKEKANNKNKHHIFKTKQQLQDHLENMNPELQICRMHKFDEKTLNLTYENKIKKAKKYIIRKDRIYHSSMRKTSGSTPPTIRNISPNFYDANIKNSKKQIVGSRCIPKYRTEAEESDFFINRINTINEKIDMKRLSNMNITRYQPKIINDNVTNQENQRFLSDIQPWEIKFDDHIGW